jgi:serine phosphatase RsbU (regulator of sigma subunit)
VVAIPLVLILVITLADLLSPEDVHLGPLLVVAPALTASFGSSRLTALVGALAVGALLAISLIRNSITTANHESQLVSLILISAFTVLFSRLRERNTAELRQVRSVAETAQQVVLRPLPERIGSVRIAFTYQAAADQARIGGDLYAAVRTRHATRLLIGDVRGKGLTAVGDAAVLLGAFRSSAHRELSLPALLAELEETVHWDLTHSARDDTDADESFITAVLLDVLDDEPEVRILNSGHPAPLRLRAGDVTVLAPGQYAPPIGLCLPRSSGAVVDTFAFAPGDMLLLYTDGASEARDGTGRFYPLTDRVAGLAADTAPGELIDHVRADLLAYTSGTLGDDAALVAVRRETRPAATPADPAEAGS